MANIKQQKKRILTDERNRLRNIAVRTRIKTYTKNALEAFETKDAAQVQPALLKIVSELDRAVTKGVMHKSTASRKKSRLTLKANAAV
jgi:small subunit ribosomal protein S20